jgi:hypothetical protein
MRNKIILLVTLALSPCFVQAADRELLNSIDPVFDSVPALTPLPICTSADLKNTPDADKRKDGCFCKNMGSYDYQTGIGYDFCKLTHDPSITPCCWQGKTP